MVNPSIARESLAPAHGEARGTLHKNQLRSTLLAQRKALSDDAKAAAEARLAARLLQWCQAQQVSSLAVYQPIRREPDLHVAYNALAARGVHLSLPVVIGADLPLQFRAWRPGDALEKDGMGTLVPAPGAAVVVPQALLIPCLGFNDGHYRLGYGGGFYDRTLAASPRPLTAGVCYGFGRVQFEAQAHDVPLDLILTDA